VRVICDRKSTVKFDQVQVQLGINFSRERRIKFVLSQNSNNSMHNNFVVEAARARGHKIYFADHPYSVILFKHIAY